MRASAAVRTHTTHHASLCVPEEVLDYNEIIETFLHWSGKYELFNREENLEMVFRPPMTQVNGWQLFKRLIVHDNPNMKFHRIEMD